MGLGLWLGAPCQGRGWLQVSTEGPRVPPVEQPLVRKW